MPEPTGKGRDPGEGARRQAQIDRSAGEAGEPSDMDYYRKTKPVGSRLAAGAWAGALVLLALIAVAGLGFLLFR